MTSNVWAYPLHDAAPVQLSGPDRIDFLQRQTTNDMSQLADGQAVATVLTSPTARILDLFTVVPFDDDALLILPGSGRSDALSTYLRGKIFFMDKVTVSGPMPGYTSWLVVGSDAPGVLSDAGYLLPGEGAYSLAKRAGNPAWIITLPGWPALAYHLVLPTDAAPPATVLTDAEFERERIKAGLPAVGHELTDTYTPFEVGLGTLVSGTKGCYTGQEILARQVTYDKVTRQLCGLRLSADVAPDAELRAEGKKAGVVTSVLATDEHGVLALAVIRKPYHEPETKVWVQAAKGDVSAIVVELPFTE